MFLTYACGDPRLNPRQYLGVKCRILLSAASYNCNAHTGHSKVCMLPIYAVTDEDELLPSQDQISSNAHEMLFLTSYRTLAMIGTPPKSTFF